MEVMKLNFPSKRQILLQARDADDLIRERMKLFTSKILLK